MVFEFGIAIKREFGGGEVLEETRDQDGFCPAGIDACQARNGF